jgi:alkaline phosphatase
VTAIVRTRHCTALAVLALAVLAPAVAPAQEPAAARDLLARLQADNVATARASRPRAYHFGSQGTPGIFSNHSSHTNRLVPVYTFGSKLDLGAVTGKNSIYRDAKRLEALYGYLPEHTVNPGADYADQSDLRTVLDAAVARGVKHLFIVWFDGTDWPTMQAAAVAKTGKVYNAGKGSGLVFQDYDAQGTAGFGYAVTSPTHDRNTPNVDAQTVVIPASSARGGYDARIAGPNPWTPGPLAAQAPGYLKGPSGNEKDKAGVKAAGGVPHAYTDSSCSAAEFIDGAKSYNNGLNVKDDGTFVPTLFNVLETQGWRLGTATSVPFDHASPAAMYAHNVYRDDYQDIARDMLGLTSITQLTHKEPAHRGLDVALGTGFGQESGLRGIISQGKNVVPGNLYITDADKAAIDARHGGPYVVAQTTPGARGAKVLGEAAALAASQGLRLFGLFGDKGLNHLPYRTADGRFDPAPDVSGKAETYTPEVLAEQPTLADMTRASLTVLTSRLGRKFALFVEAGDVDFALHSNNLDNTVGAVYSGEDAVKVIIDWVETHSNWNDSAMIVTADHGHYLVIDDLDAIARAR